MFCGGKKKEILNIYIYKLKKEDISGLEPLSSSSLSFSVFLPLLIYTCISLFLIFTH